jgi:nitronate monooxygenase
VNVFVPQPPAADPDDVWAYLASLDADAARLGAALGEPSWDDDHWDAKLALLLTEPVPVVSFTFGCPSPHVIRALQAVGTLVVVTVTTPDEAAVAADAGADCVCAQGIEAGAHRGGFTDDERPGRDYGLLSLIGEIARVREVPILATGGIGGPRAVAAVLAAGAVGAQVGTTFLRCPESGAHPVYRAALADPRFTHTAVTRAFSGRRARGLVNAFLLDHPDAPAAYPQINNATRPLRTAAAAADDPDRMSLWAGQAFRSATDRPAGEIVEHLAAGVRRTVT